MIEAGNSNIRLFSAGQLYKAIGRKDEKNRKGLVKGASAELMAVWTTPVLTSSLVSSSHHAFITVLP